MWIWILSFLLIILTLAVMEETIQFAVNRHLYGRSKMEMKLRFQLRRVLDYIKKKLHKKHQPNNSTQEDEL